MLSDRNCKMKCTYIATRSRTDWWEYGSWNMHCMRTSLLIGPMLIAGCSATQSAPGLSSHAATASTSNPKRDVESTSTKPSRTRTFKRRLQCPAGDTEAHGSHFACTCEPSGETFEIPDGCGPYPDADGTTCIFECYQSDASGSTKEAIVNAPTVNDKAQHSGVSAAPGTANMNSDASQSDAPAGGYDPEVVCHELVKVHSSAWDPGLWALGINSKTGNFYPILFFQRDTPARECLVWFPKLEVRQWTKGLWLRQ